MVARYIAPAQIILLRMDSGEKANKGQQVIWDTAENQLQLETSYPLARDETTVEHENRGHGMTTDLYLWHYSRKTVVFVKSCG